MARILTSALLASLLLINASAASAQAQDAPPPSPPTAIAPPDSQAVLVYNGWYLPPYQAGGPAADTAGALVFLFRHRRYAGFLYAVPFGLGMSLALPIASTDQYGRQHVASEAISPPLGSLIVAGTVVGFILHASKFNKKHLVAVDKAYAAGQPIPRKYSSQLSASHFAEAALLRKSIHQQMVRDQLRLAR